MHNYHLRWLVGLLALGFVGPLTAAEPRVIREVEYAQVKEMPLLLDLYLPAEAKKPPLIVWVHGGAWRAGSRKSMPMQDLVTRGYAVASVDYRLSPVARFPAQIHDIKAAIRFLRAHAGKYGYDPDRFCIAGASAGGHLAALVGVTNGHAQLEGKVGKCLEQSSDVQAIIDLYGPTSLTTILAQSTPHGLGVRIPALQLLLGAQPEDTPELARLASPVFHVDKHDPPLLLVHGDQDPQVPINQAHELQGAYKKHDLISHFEVVYGAAHGGKQFHDAERNNVMARFLDRYLRAPGTGKRVP